jgi:hypothetical protein
VRPSRHLSQQAQPIGGLNTLVAGVAAALALSIAGVGVAVAPASAATGATIKGVGSGRCLDVIAEATAPSTGINIYDCIGQTNQAWTFSSTGELRIYDVQSGLCLDVAGTGIANSTLVQMWTCNGQSNQKWTTSLASLDTQPPTVPANPRVSDLACDSVTFSWDAASDNVAVAFTTSTTTAS